MSNKESKDDIPALLQEDVVRFLDEKGVTPKCHACGTEKWVLMEDDDTRGVMLQAAASQKVLPVTALICSNCGNVWLIARAPILDWVKGHPHE